MIDDLEVETARQIIRKVTAGNDTGSDANAYAFLGGFAWAVGLGGTPWSGQRTCLENLQDASSAAGLVYERMTLKWADVQG